ncbi:MAG: ATP-binding protein, partial [Candidatus Micrarchaeia archaeon]
MLEEKLKDINEWWGSGRVSEEKKKEYQRGLIENIKEVLGYRQIIILVGLRRVGKTTLFFQIIDYLLKSEEAKRIFYFSFDEEKEIEVYDLLNTYSRITSIDWRKEKIYVFFDEIQKLKDWSSKIKFLY